jgi:hypothetical protein
LGIGCSGEPALEDLTSEPGATLSQVSGERLATVRQELSSVSYSTYLGFAGDENGNSIAVDGSGNTYLTGTTTSFGGITNIYVAKMSPTGTNLYYIYFPGSQSNGIAVDGTGNAYVVGTTATGPTIKKLDATGTTVVYSASLTWLDIQSIAVDTAGNAYITGSLTNGVAGTDVAVGKLNATGTAFLYAVAFGGTGTDRGNGITIDSAGNAYVVGDTSSTNFPMVSAFQTSLRGPQDAFVTKLNAAGNGLLYSTYLGGNTYDYGRDVAVDSAGNAYVTGSTASLNGVQSFPVTSGSAQSTPGGSGDAYVAKFSATGARSYATYVGGSSSDTSNSIAVSAAGVAYVTGYTQSTNFPTTSLGFQRFALGGPDAFVVQVSATGGSFAYGSYLGGSSTDIGSAIAVDASGNAYVSGNTFSTNFPTNVYAPGGLYDAFVTKFNGP